MVLNGVHALLEPATLWTEPAAQKPTDNPAYNGLYGKALPERGTFFRFPVYERVGISQAEVYKRVGKSVI